MHLIMGGTYLLTQDESWSVWHHIRCLRQYPSKTLRPPIIILSPSTNISRAADPLLFARCISFHPGGSALAETSDPFVQLSPRSIHTPTPCCFCCACARLSSSNTVRHSLLSLGCVEFLVLPEVKLALFTRGFPTANFFVRPSLPRVVAHGPLPTYISLRQPRSPPEKPGLLRFIQYGNE
ncbi:hypothetical protein LZ30DRAFT_180654 [Colletotrichum cereale]|nr:hypothetical protein LZ30DRAFT_180654 [Colletotrichum cereale]